MFALVSDLDGVMHKEFSCPFELKRVRILRINPVELQSRKPSRSVELVGEYDVENGLVLENRALCNVVASAIILEHLEEEI